MESNHTTRNVILISLGLALVCICVACVGLVGYGYYIYQEYDLDQVISQIPLGELTPLPPVEMTRPAVEDIPLDTLLALQNTLVPENDPKDLACRLEGKCDIPETMAAPAAPRVVGDTDTFWVTNVESNENFEVNAVLEYVTPHVYFWVEQEVDFDMEELRALADAFEQKIYPTDREFFGSEWSPGIDQDEHIYILYARGLGFSIAGYFSAADELHPLAHEYSNAHEMFIFNADNTPLGSDFTYGVLAHEFQHMIHWAQDRNETSWINEGFAEVAAFLNGYDPGGFDWLYISDPDLQLNDWPNDQNATSPHYGAGFLYLTYFLDRFGEDATKAVVKDAANGFDGIDNSLQALNATDPFSGDPIRADDLFMDWAVTNYVLDETVEDGRYTYDIYPNAKQASATESIDTCPTQDSDPSRGVHQYGVDYIKVTCPGDFTLTFTGSTVTGLLPTAAYSGEYAFWSNKGDESNMTLTRQFDFSNTSTPIKINYRTWYDLEEDYDYVYLEASEDGEHWQILITPSGTGEDPSGNSYGWGYNGVSEGWIEESVDLSKYAGKTIQLRFEYVTDAAVNGEGLLLDDISIEAVNATTDFETDEGGWQPDGFVRVQNVLPQTFRLAWILKKGGMSVEMIPVSEDQVAQIPFSLKPGEEATLVVSGTTRYTRERGAYQIQIR